ncbi:MAG: HAMP domain-containing histidine kinase [Erysipelotrichaceae bacterium]|nr:HAMP domain-containing histidine kinase [Erysipelotrichaceae bacterium]
MKRGIKIFAFLYGLIAVVLAASVAYTAFRLCGQRKIPSYNEANVTEIDLMAQAFLTFKVHDMEPASDMLDLTERQWKRLENEFNNISELGSSPNFRWKITLNNESMGSKEEPSKDDSSLYTKYTYGKQNSVKSRESTSPFVPSVTGSVLTLDPSIYETQLLSREELLAGVQYPEGLEMEYSIPTTLTPPSQRSEFYNLLTAREAYMETIMLFGGMALLMMTVLVSVWPFAEEQHMLVFSWVSTAKFESVLIFSLLAISFTASCFWTALNQLNSAYEVVQGTLQVFIVQSIYTGLTSSLLVCALSLLVYWLKDILYFGVGDYFRTRSILISRWAKFSDVLWRDTYFSKKTGWRPIFFISSIAALVALLVQNWYFMAATVAAIIGWQTWANIRLSNSFHLLYSEARKLSQGDFEIPENVEDSVTTPIHKELVEIRTAWKKTLDQELASRESKNELIGNVSHDLKTPLTGLKNYSELLQRAKSEEDRRKFAAKIAEYTSRLTDLVEDLFDIAKANDNVLELEMMNLRLDDLILAAVDEHQQDLEKKNIDLVVTFHDRPLMVHMDPYKTMRIFDNLIGNTSKYAKADTRSFISSRDLDDRIEVTVKNTSDKPLNFSEEEIVERFVRGDRSRSEVGSGLGLAIVKSFAEIQGGEFKIEIDGDLFKAVLRIPKLKEQTNTEQPI